jgi:hypothetical protein
VSRRSSTRAGAAPTPALGRRAKRLRLRRGRFRDDRDARVGAACDRRLKGAVRNERRPSGSATRRTATPSR